MRSGRCHPAATRASPLRRRTTDTPVGRAPHARHATQRTTLTTLAGLRLLPCPSLSCCCSRRCGSCLGGRSGRSGSSGSGCRRRRSLHLSRAPIPPPQRLIAVKRQLRLLLPSLPRLLCSERRQHRQRVDAQLEHWQAVPAMADLPLSFAPPPRPLQLFLLPPLSALRLLAPMESASPRPLPTTTTAVDCRRP